MQQGAVWTGRVVLKKTLIDGFTSLLRTGTFASIKCQSTKRRTEIMIMGSRKAAI